MPETTQPSKTAAPEASASPGARRTRVPLNKRHFQNWLWLALLVIGLPVVYRPGHGTTPEALRCWTDFLGAALLVGGVLIRVLARGWKREQQRKELVTDGLYGVIRHPLYLGSFLLGLGLCSLIGDLPVAAWFAVCFWVGHAPVIRDEERFLVGRHGDAFVEYKSRVPALLPTPAGLFSRRRVRPSDLSGAIASEADAVCLWPVLGVLTKAADQWAAFGSLTPQILALIGIAVALVSLWAVLKRQLRSPRV